MADKDPEGVVTHRLKNAAPHGWFFSLAWIVFMLNLEDLRWCDLELVCGVWYMRFGGSYKGRDGLRHLLMERLNLTCWMYWFCNDCGKQNFSPGYWISESLSMLFYVAIKSLQMLNQDFERWKLVWIILVESRSLQGWFSKAGELWGWSWLWR